MAADHTVIALSAGTRLLIDADDAEQSSAARFINHSRRRENCEFKQLFIPLNLLGQREVMLDTFVVHMATSRPVKRGQEFLVDYGSTYWDTRFPRTWPHVLNPQRLVIDYL